eukprot:4882457-Karenia_brevis.AAC.1
MTSRTVWVTPVPMLCVGDYNVEFVVFGQLDNKCSPIVPKPFKAPWPVHMQTPPGQYCHPSSGV